MLLDTLRMSILSNESGRVNQMSIEKKERMYRFYRKSFLSMFVTAVYILRIATDH